MAIILRDQYTVNTGDDQARLIAEQAAAENMGSLRRGYEAGRIGTDINANLIDEASLRSAGRTAEADALAVQTRAAQARQAMYAPRVGRVEDISGVGDALSWAGTQIGQGVASMQDPVALTAAGTALGRLPGLGRLAPIAGAIGAFGLNQRQMAGEHYGNLREDPTAMANLGAQGAYRQANTVGVLGGALDTVLPGMAGRALGGAALTRGAAGMLGRNTGTKALGGTVLEGATEVGQGELGRTAIGMVNPDRDTSGDASARRNEFAGGAVGGAPFSVAGAMADSAYGRAGRAGELVKEKTGEIVDLTKEKGAQAYEDTGIKGVVDLGMQGGKSVLGNLGKVGKAAQDYMRDATGKINYAEGIKRAQADVERFKMSQEEADLLTAVPPAEADPDTLSKWTEQNYADRTNYVFGKLEALERDGVQEATGFLDALESDDPVARTQAVDEATSFLLERNTAAQVRERATLFQAAIGEFIQKGAARMTRGAKAAGDAAAFAGLNVAEGVKQGLESKKNMQGAGFSTLDYDTWKAWRDQNSPPLGEDSQRAHAIQKAVEGRSRLKELRGKPLPADPEAAKRSYERATLFGEMLAAEAAARRTKVMGHRADETDGVIDYTNYVRSLAYEIEDMASSWDGRAGAGTRPTGTDTRQAGVALGLVDSMAEDLNNVLGPAASDVVARMAQSAEPTAKAFFDVLQERVANRQATMAERKVQDQTLQDQMLALLPQEHQAALREDGGAGARNLQQTVQMIARGRVPPTKRREIEKAIGAGTLNRMLSLYGETAAPETQVGAVVDDTGNEEIQNADILTVTDDGEVDPNARIDDFEKRQAERKAARNSAPRMYAFYGEKAQSLRTTDSERRTARNPFEPLKRMSPSEAAKAREAAAAAELAGEGGKPVIPNARPRLLRMDAEGAAEGIANKISQLEKTLGVDRTPENFFRLAKEELKGVAQAKKRESLAALEKAYAEGDEAAQTRVAEMTERFFETRAGDYVVNAVSAKQVMDELGMPPSQRLAIFRDYMFQEGHRAREKDPAASKRFYALARNAQAQLLDGGFEPNRGAAAENADTPTRSGVGIKRNVARLSAGERRTLQTAMERYFGEGYLVAAEQLSDRVPGTMAVGELLEMARKGNQAREAVRGDANKSGSDTVANAARAELEGSLLNFPQRAGVNLLGTKDATTLSIKASNLVAWVRNNRREDGADTKSDGKTKLGEEAQFLRDLQEGIATITNMDAIDGLPYVVGPDGEKQRFTDRGVPDALQLPNRAGWSFNRGKAERVAKAAGKDAPEPRSQMEVANDQMRSDDWFVADPLEGATDNVKYTTFEEPKNKGAGVGTSPAVRRTVFADRDTDAQHAPVNRQANRDDADVSPLDTKLFLDAGQAEYDDQKLRSKDAGEGVGRESAMDAVKRAEERASSIVAYTGPAREVTEGGTLTRVDRDIDARATLTNIQRRVIAARLGGLKGLERELTPKEAALQKKYDGFASGKHYAYPLAHALSVKNVQDLLDSGAFSPAQMDFLVDQQRMAAQIINTAPAGVRLQLAKAMMDGREDVTNYGQASQALAALAKGVSYKSAAPEVAATGAPKSQPKPGGVKLSGKTPFTPKDQAKADRATKFIGRGSERSSTAQYAKDFGALANTGSYTAADTVFVSAEGARAGRVEPNFAEIDRAVAAGATIITDNAENRAREYNVGERQVAAHLAKKGYVETSPGTWTAPKRKLSLMSTQIHNDLRRPGFAATHDSPIRHEGRFNWREHTGKGEGNAAFGAGTYLSTGEGVHKFYKKMMTAKVGGDGLPNDPAYLALQDKLASVRWNPSSPEKTRLMNEIKAQMKAIEDQYKHDGMGSGKSPTYHVSVNIMKAQLLNWDKPLSEQSSYVRKRLEEAKRQMAEFVAADLGGGTYDARLAYAAEKMSGAPGKSIYGFLTERLGSQAAASDYLQSLGILGHEYAAANGRDGKTPNYVIYDDSKISTNYVHFNKQEANNFENWKNGPHARAAQGMATDADLKAAREYFDRVLGKQVKAEFENITGYSGEFIEADNLIKVSTLTNAGVMNVARHEALHAFFSKFIKANPKAVKVLSSLTNNERVLRRLQTLLKDEPAALEQLVDGEERLAYIYQFAMAGQLRLPHTPGTTLMHKVRKFLRRVFQMVSDDERAVDLLYAFEHGKMSNPSAGARAMAKVLDQGTWMTKGARSIDAVTQRAAAMVLPANTILAESISPTARALAKQFFTNPGEEGAAEGGKGYLNARNEGMRRYDNLFRKAIDKLDKRQLDELTEAMQNETPTGDVRDPDVAAAKEQLHALFERFHRYLTEEKGLRIGKINEGYFPVVYDVDKVREGGLEKLLSGKYIGEINKMAAAINDKRASKNPDAEMVSSDDVISAIVNHITRDNPLDDADLEPQRQDGVLRPWFASGEKRVLDFLSPEDRAQFQEKDIIKTVSRYVRQGVRTAEYSSRFGRTGALLDQQLGKIQKELEAASREMLASGDLKNEKAREKWVKRQYRDVANAVGGMEGSLGSDVSEGVRKINSWSIVYQNVRLLPLALFSSFVDPLGIVARGGEMREAFTTFTEGIKGVARQWTDAIREEPADRQKSQWEELAEHAGVIDTATFSHLLADEYGSVYLDGTTKKINEVMFKANGMEAWNRAMRVGATRSAVRFMERHNKAPTEHSARWMKDLGFEPGTLPLDSEGRLITDKRVLMSENPDMKMEEAEAKIAKVHSAINRWVEGAILSPNAAQRPAWGSDPHFSMFWHLKQFAYSFHETIMKRALNEAKHGNVMPLGVFAWYIPTMIAADVTKGLMLGAGELPAYMKGYDLGDWMLHGVERSGVLGIGQVAIDGVQDPTGLAGPAVEQITDIFVQPMEQNIVKALPVNALYSRALL